MEHGVAWASRVRRLARDDERRDVTLAGFPSVAFALLALHAVLSLLWVL